MVGAEASFSAVHLLRAMFALLEGEVSKERLAKNLGIGDGSIRTLLKRLKQEGLVTSSRSGHRLSNKGEEVVGKIKSVISSPVRVASVKNGCAVHIKGKSVSSGLALRDDAVRAGASMALVLNIRRGRVSFPEKGVEFCDNMPELDEEIVDGLGVEDGVVVVCSAEDYNSAENAVLTVAMKFSDNLGFVTGSSLS
jgi:biotin operon repressor